MPSPADPDDKRALGPNTGASATVLHRDCILCAGEDRSEFLEALQGAGAGEALEQSRYRCYEFWRFDSFCAIWTGIGAGCLEPLLWEVLGPATIERIILVGTAGAMPGAKVELGMAYAIDAAWSAGTALDAMALDWPMRFRWYNAIPLPTASSVSTDFYYGFGPARPGRRAQSETHDPSSLAPLSASYADHVQRGTQLVEMEVAPFYYLCRAYGPDWLQYVAIKAPANPVGDVEQQRAHSPAALLRTFQTARAVLGYIPRTEA